MLLEKYREYDLISQEGSQENKAWIYFVETFLSAVNAKVTNFKEKK